MAGQAVEIARVRKGSPFARFENFTVLVIFLCFIVVVAVLQLIVFGWGFPTFISPENLFNILQQTSAPGVVAVGMTMVMIAGGIDLSVGMMASLVSIVVALGFSNWNLGVVPSIVRMSPP